MAVKMDIKDVTAEDLTNIEASQVYRRTLFLRWDEESGLIHRNGCFLDCSFDRYLALFISAI